MGCGQSSGTETAASEPKNETARTTDTETNEQKPQEQTQEQNKVESDPPVVEQQKDEASTPAPQTQDDGNVKKQKIRDEILAAHNEYRAKNGAEELKQADDLNELAQKWAESMLSKFEHSTADHRGDKGENIWQGGVDVTGKGVTDAFSVEKGQFTQVVSKETTEIGTGYAQNDQGAVVCCNYRPAGNLEGDADPSVGN